MLKDKKKQDCIIAYLIRMESKYYKAGNSIYLFSFSVLLFFRQCYCGFEMVSGRIFFSTGGDV